ncbi:MAG: hypothetical protein QNJ65_21215 [Xenococcaceae cyanobacterium MO_234.B1]|nr:hypothetical protein [Xenococcaceae cyanobacterium MO_234.B1]
MAVDKLPLILSGEIWLIDSFLGYFWEFFAEFNSLPLPQYLEFLLLEKTINFQALN